MLAGSYTPRNSPLLHLSLPALKSLLASSTNGPRVSRALHGKNRNCCRIRKPEEEKQAEGPQLAAPCKQEPQERKEDSFDFLMRFKKIVTTVALKDIPSQYEKKRLDLKEASPLLFFLTLHIPELK